jgi:hypothetical protein
MDKISLPVRIFAIAIVLVGLAGMLAMRTMGPSEEPAAIPLPVKTPAANAEPAKPTAAPKATAKVPPLNAPKVVKQALPPTGFPSVVDRALRDHEVVVLSLVVPGARVDELAAAEAEAGARLGGAGFLALNVLNESVARALLTKLDSVQDPSVLVVQRSGDIALSLTGFVDRETVAQAAANASP